MILSPAPPNILQAVHVIKQGCLIAYPTETVYGLGADPFNIDAIARIFAAKGRAADQSILLLIRNNIDLAKLTTEIPPIAETLINTFWPGPLTLVFKAHPDLPAPLLGGRKTIALRHSSSPVASNLLQNLGSPLTSTSANRSGQPPARSATEVQNTLGDHLDLILDGGPSASTAPSTLVDISTDRAILLREGAISRQTLRKHIPIHIK